MRRRTAENQKQFGLKCPHCHSTKHTIVGKAYHNDTFRRRRRCQECVKRFSTVETVVSGHFEKAKRPTLSSVAKSLNEMPFK